MINQKLLIAVTRTMICTHAHWNELATTVLVKGTTDISNLTWQPYKGSIMIASLPDEFIIAQYPEPLQQRFHNKMMMMMEAR